MDSERKDVDYAATTSDDIAVNLTPSYNNINMNLPTRKSLKKAKTSSTRDSDVKRVSKENSISLTEEKLNPYLCNCLNCTSFVVNGLSTLQSLRTASHFI